MAEKLNTRRCIPCEGSVPPLSSDDVRRFQREVPFWSVSSDGRFLCRTYRFKNFVESLVFVNDVAHIAEKEGHHPDIGISYDRVKLALTTHAANGLTENDFILAAKIDTEIVPPPV